MEYQEFKMELVEVLKKQLPEKDGYKISVSEQRKNQRKEEIHIEHPTERESTDLSLHNLYFIHEMSEQSVPDLAEMITETVHECERCFLSAKLFRKIDPKDYDSIKDHLFVELTRSEQNGVFLSNGIYERKAFGALVPYIAVRADRTEMRTRITPEMIESFGVSQRELMKQAMENTCTLKLSSILKVENKGNFPAYVITGRESQGGATAIFYPGMLEKIRNKMGMDYFIAPASTREVYAIGKVEGLRADMIKTVLEQIAPKIDAADRLDAKVYEYCGAEKKLSVCKPEKARKMER